MAAIKREGGLWFQDRPVLADFMFAVPNGVALGGGRANRARYMAALKRRGLKPGVSDLVIPLPVGPYHGMFLELKRETKGDVTRDQQLWDTLVRCVGYHSVIARGYDAAVAAITAYLSNSV